MKLITWLGIMVVLTSSIGCDKETRVLNQYTTPLTTCDSTNSVHPPQLTTTEYDRVSLGFGKVHNGMTEDQVQQVIGPPTSKSRNSSGWIWRFTNIGAADEEVYVVFFTNGIVAEMNHVKSFYTSSGKTNAEPER